MSSAVTVLAMKFSAFVLCCTAIFVTQSVVACENNALANPNKQYGISVDVQKIKSYRSMGLMGSYYVDRTSLVPTSIDLAGDVENKSELLLAKKFLTNTGLQGQLVVTRYVHLDSIQRHIQIAVELEEHKYAVVFVGYYEKLDNSDELDDIEAYVTGSVAKSVCKR